MMFPLSVLQTEATEKQPHTYLSKHWGAQKFQQQTQ